MKKKNILISCDEAKEICDKLQYNEASWLDKIKFQFRSLYCHVTRSYAKKNQQLTSTCQKAKIDCMHAHEKKELQEQINAHLKQQ